MENGDAEKSERRRERSPCIPVVLAYGIGIVADHGLALPRPTLLLAAAFLLACLITLIALRSTERRSRVAVLLLLFLLLGAASHGAAWRDRGAGSITRRLSDHPRLATITGTVLTPPTIDRRRESGRRAAWLLEDRTRMIVTLSGIAAEPGERTATVTGRVQISAAGHLIHLEPGDRFEATGWLSRPRPPRNPGGFDICNYLRTQRIDATFSTDHPDAVRRLDTSDFNWRRSVAAQRQRFSVLFASHLSGANGPVGAAMILGDRSTMPLDIRDAYVASGAMHILAISGLHVGILAMFLMTIGRLLQFSSTATTIAVLLCVWLYAVLTNLEPPVVRAAVFLTNWSLASLTMRRSTLLNVVASTALLLTLVDPLLVFDVGAQLSFLAIVGIVWTLRTFPAANALRIGHDEESGRWSSRIWRPLLATQMLGLGIWIFTAPLIASVFGIVSPAAILLNVVLIPLVTVVLWSGYAFFGACLLAPQAAGAFGALFDLGLTVVNSTVMGVGEWRFGHLAVPGPPGWWLAGFYGLLVIPLLREWPSKRRLSRWYAPMVWTGMGLATGLAPASDGRTLRVTALDVGHGGAALIELPNGRLLLVDCGSMEDNRWPAEAVWNAVRQRGTMRLDAVVVTHADLDHGNNVPALIRGGTVGSLLVARSFLDFDQTVVRRACDAAREAGIPIRLVAAGSRIDVDPNVALEVLHPSDCRPGDDDNANSIVLRIRYGSRTVLLTGDLEGSGQAELFARHPEGGYDVLFAPHHGGRKANTWETADWARPNVVVVSASRRVNETALQNTYRDARLYLTPRHGAITIAIDAGGRMGVETRLPIAD